MLRFILFLLSAIPSLANKVTPDGLTAWELNILSGSKVFANILTSMVMFVNSSEFMTLASTLALLGFFALMVGSVGGLDGKKIGMFFLGITIISITTFKMTIDVFVVDMVSSNGVSAPILVQDVPASVGFPAVAINEIGQSFARQIDKFFSPVNADLAYSNTRTLNMEGQILQDIMNAKPYSPQVEATLSEFYVQCVFPLIERGELTVKEISESPNIFDGLADKVPKNAVTRVFFEKDPNKEMMACHEAHPEIKEVIDKAANAFSSSETSTMATKMKAEGMNSTLGDLGNSILSQINTGSAQTTSDVVKNRGVLRAFEKGFARQGATVERGAMVEAMIVEQSIEQQLSGWKMAAEIFNTTVGYLAVALHAFILGISPIILTMFFLPGIANKILVSYFQILIWLAMWEPMLTIINYIIVSFQENNLIYSIKETQENADGTTTTVASGIYYSLINAATEKFQIVGGFLGASVPMIAWGLVKGGMAFSQFLSSGLGGSIAAGAAKNLASGSLSHDSVSFNNTSGNSHSTSLSTDVGYKAGEVGALQGGGAQVNRQNARDFSSNNGNQVQYSAQDAFKTQAQVAQNKSAQYANAAIDSTVKAYGEQVGHIGADIASGSIKLGDNGQYIQLESGGTQAAEANQFVSGFSEAKQNDVTTAATLSAQTNAMGTLTKLSTADPSLFEKLKSSDYKGSNPKEREAIEALNNSGISSKQIADVLNIAEEKGDKLTYGQLAGTGVSANLAADLIGSVPLLSGAASAIKNTIPKAEVTSDEKAMETLALKKVDTISESATQSEITQHAEQIQHQQAQVRANEKLFSTSNTKNDSNTYSLTDSEGVNRNLQISESYSDIASKSRESSEGTSTTIGITHEELAAINKQFDDKMRATELQANNVDASNLESAPKDLQELHNSGIESNAEENFKNKKTEEENAKAQKAAEKAHEEAIEKPQEQLNEYAHDVNDGSKREDALEDRIDNRITTQGLKDATGGIISERAGTMSEVADQIKGKKDTIDDLAVANVVAEGKALEKGESIIIDFPDDQTLSNTHSDGENQYRGDGYYFRKDENGTVSEGYVYHNTEKEESQRYILNDDGSMSPIVQTHDEEGQPLDVRDPGDGAFMTRTVGEDVINNRLTETTKAVDVKNKEDQKEDLEARVRPSGFGKH